jgi:hypothetical protein
VWDKNDWLFEGQHGFRPGYSRENQVMSVCQDIADSLDNGDIIDAIMEIVIFIIIQRKRKKEKKTKQHSVYTYVNCEKF